MDQGKSISVKCQGDLVGHLPFFENCCCYCRLSLAAPFLYNYIVKIPRARMLYSTDRKTHGGEEEKLH